MAASMLMLLALNACADVLDGTSQVVTIRTVDGSKYVSGSQCVLTNDKGVWFVTAPGSVAVHRSYDDLNVRCQAAGYIANAGAAPSHSKDLTAGNLIVGGLIGMGLDIGEGSAYDYPNPITVNLQPIASTTVANGNKR
jgi:hypothetical protein